jgi:hypothetical protein
MITSLLVQLADGRIYQPSADSKKIELLRKDGSVQSDFIFTELASLRIEVLLLHIIEEEANRGILFDTYSNLHIVHGDLEAVCGALDVETLQEAVQKSFAARDRKAQLHDEAPAPHKDSSK